MAARTMRSTLWEARFHQSVPAIFPKYSLLSLTVYFNLNPANPRFYVLRLYPQKCSKSRSTYLIADSVILKTSDHTQVAQTAEPT